jgi:hypothetical protein
MSFLDGVMYDELSIFVLCVTSFLEGVMSSPALCWLQLGFLLLGAAAREGGGGAAQGMCNELAIFADILINEILCFPYCMELQLVLLLLKWIYCLCLSCN